MYNPLELKLSIIYRLYIVCNIITPVPVRSSSDQIQFRSDPVPVRSSSGQIQFRSDPVPIRSSSDQIQFRSDPVPVRSSSSQIQIWSDPDLVKSRSRIFKDKFIDLRDCSAGFLQSEFSLNFFPVSIQVGWVVWLMTVRVVHMCRNSFLKLSTFKGNIQVCNKAAFLYPTS